MNNLSERLQSCARMVTAGSRLADIGSDHAYVPIALVRSGQIPSAIAMDIADGPLQAAQRNINAAGLSHRIETRLSDGLEKLSPGEADTLLLAGMGGALIRRILSSHTKVRDSAKELVLQPQTETARVRRFLRSQGFRIDAEDIVREENKYYFILRAHPAGETVDGTELEDLFGPVLLRGHPLLTEWLLRSQYIYEGILKSLEQAADTERNRQTEAEAAHMLEMISQARTCAKHWRKE